MEQKDIKIAVIGLGYVGLPLAVAFAEKYPVHGFDINPIRLDEINQGKDTTLEITSQQLSQVLTKKSSQGLYCSSSEQDLEEANIFIITVPTPIDKNKNPDLTPLIKASELVGRVLKPADIVIYESTVYPGATEEVCIPILEKHSNLSFNTDFYCGYSPERINPGDKVHTLAKILKVTSGSTPEIAEKVDQLYDSIITAGTFKASSIKVAEAAKVIENSQRDINIAFVNELSKIFSLLDIDTHEVLAAAGTKWNFLPFTPGLVGGHCIGVDPYYLAKKAEEVGYNPEIILAGRRLNDGMGAYVASQVIKLLINNDLKIKGAKVLILGMTFKENCPDVRNSKVIDIITEFGAFGTHVSVYDPHANKDIVKREYNIDLIESPAGQYDAIVLAVAHQEFKLLDFKALKKEHGVVYDVKGFLNKEVVDQRL
jgi:UDP-N-acetyl-D-galactosamine dehydrogenase